MGSLLAVWSGSHTRKLLYVSDCQTASVKSLLRKVLAWDNVGWILKCHLYEQGMAVTAKASASWWPESAILHCTVLGHVDEVIEKYYMVVPRTLKVLH